MNALPEGYGLGVAFTVPGRPVPYVLGKRISKSGFVGFYLAPETAAYEEVVGLFARRACRVPLKGPVHLTLRFYVYCAKGDRPPDVTNLQKSTEDGCKRIAFGDDLWVCGVDSRRKIVKTRAEERVEIRVRKLREGEWPDD